MKTNSFLPGMEMAPRLRALVAGITSFTDTPEEIYSEIKRHVETGVDNVKLSMSGEEMDYWELFSSGQL